MKDPVFSGRDVSDAVRQASRTLGVPEAALRYVVLDPGQRGGRGLAATEARIAVLVQELGRDEAAPRRASRAARQTTSAEQRGEEGSPGAAARALVEEFARSAGRRIDADVVAASEALDVNLEGDGTSILFDPRGETLAALEHLLERVCDPGGRVRVRCAGYREYRDERLREEALALARQVRGDGQPRRTEPLNSYERRVVHLALDGDPDVHTFSVGEGRGRLVTVAPRATSKPGELADTAAPPRPLAGGRADDNEPPGEFDARRYDRPPQDGGASELM